MCNKIFVGWVDKPVLVTMTTMFAIINTIIITRIRPTGRSMFRLRSFPGYYKKLEQ